MITKEFLSESSNEKNHENIECLLDHFFLSGTSYRKVKNSINSRQWLDDWLNLDEYKRLWLPITLPEDKDTSYSLYKKYLKNCQKMNIKNYFELISYHTFKTGKFQGQKLFKYLRKKNIFSKEQIEDITTRKQSSNEMYLCISRNPIDILFASTNQSYSSCINLESDYSEAYYFGLPAFMADKNRCIVFICNGKFRRHNIGDYEFKHFRYIARTFGIITSNGELYLPRFYPSDAWEDTILDTLQGFFPTSTMGKSLFPAPKIYNEDRDILMPYLDNMRYYDHYVQGGSGGMDCYHWRDGFSEAIGRDIEELKEGDGCYNCGCQADEETCYHVEGDCYCEDCYHDMFSYCEKCDGTVSQDETVHITDIDIWCCRNCRDYYYSICDHCGDNISETRETISGEEYCSDCSDGLPWCDECGRVINDADYTHTDDGVYCSECYEEEVHV